MYYSAPNYTETDITLIKDLLCLTQMVRSIK